MELERLQLWEVARGAGKIPASRRRQSTRTKAELLPFGERISCLASGEEIKPSGRRLSPLAGDFRAVARTRWSVQLRRIV